MKACIYKQNLFGKKDCKTQIIPVQKLFTFEFENNKDLIDIVNRTKKLFPNAAVWAGYKFDYMED